MNRSQSEIFENPKKVQKFENYNKNSNMSYFIGSIFIINWKGGFLTNFIDIRVLQSSLCYKEVHSEYYLS